VPIGSVIAGTVAATGEELDIRMPIPTPIQSAFDRILNFRTKDLLALPVFNREGLVVGVLELLNRLRADPGTGSRLPSGNIDLFGLALENAWLYQQALDKQKIEEELLACVIGWHKWNGCS